MIERIVRILVAAGATPASAARAAVILDRGGRVQDAAVELVFDQPAGLDEDLRAQISLAGCSCDRRFVEVAHDIDCPVHGLARSLG